jgi:hypothetical protein
MRLKQPCSILEKKSASARAGVGRKRRSTVPGRIRSMRKRLLVLQYYKLTVAVLRFHSGKVSVKKSDSCLDAVRT